MLDFETLLQIRFSSTFPPPTKKMMGNRSIRGPSLLALAVSHGLGVFLTCRLQPNVTLCLRLRVHGHAPLPMCWPPPVPSLSIGPHHGWGTPHTSGKKNAVRKGMFVWLILRRKSVEIENYFPPLK